MRKFITFASNVNDACRIQNNIIQFLLEQPETSLKISYVPGVEKAYVRYKAFSPGETVLHWAVYKGKFDVIRKILESRNWNLREKMEVLNMACPEKGLTPLEFARKNEHIEVVDVSFFFSRNY